MKRFLIVILSIALAFSCLGVSAFAAGEQGDGQEGEGGQGGNQPANLPATIDFEQSYFNAAGGISVYAGSTFSIRFTFNVGSYTGGRATATVSGSDFSLNYISADVPITPNETSVLSVKAGRDISTGRHKLTVVVNYVYDGMTYSFSRDINIDATGYTEPEEPDIPEAPDGTVGLTITSAPENDIMPGDTFTVGFRTVLNNIYSQYYGYGYTSNLSGTVTVSGEGFTLAGAIAEQQISSGSSSVDILCDPKATGGRKQVALTVRFTLDGKEYTDTKNINVNVIGDEEEKEEVDESKEHANFSLVSASIPEKKGRSNLSTKLTMVFKNNTDYTAENLKVKLAGLGDDIILNTYTDTAEAGDVKGGESVTASFPIKFKEYPTVQTKLDVEVSYDSIAGPQTETFSIYLQATEKKKEDETVPEDKKSLKPKVIVSSYSVEADNEKNEVVSGEEFTLKIVLENTSVDKDLRNMTVNVTPGANYNTGTNGSGASGGPVFSFIDGTSSFYTDMFEKSSTKEYSIRLKCSASAGAGSYPIDVSFDFEYELDSGNGYDNGNGELSINLPVTQPIKFDLMEWTPPTECGPDGVELSFQYFNKSKNPMTALGISVEGDFEMPTQYPGSLAASSYEYFSGTMTPVDPSAVGETKQAVLVFTFEDSAGAEQRIEYPFDVTIVETSSMGDDMMMGDDMGMMGGDNGFDVMDPNMGGDMMFDEFGNPVSSETEQQSGLPLWAKIAIPAAVVVVIIIAAVVITKKVKAKRLAEDEDDDE